MGLDVDIGRILGQYKGSAWAQPTEQTEQDFEQIAQQAPHEELSQGITEAFRSDQTPPFGQMVGQLFGQGDTHQRTGMLNQLISGVGPSLIGSLLGGGALRSLGGLFNQGSNQATELTPEQVQQLHPEQVQEIASRAEQENPGIVEKMSSFYAQHPTLVKTLGGAALAIAMGKMSRRNDS